MTECLLDAKAVADLLSVSIRTVRRLRELGKLPSPVRVGRQLRWRRSDIDAFIASL